MRVYQKKNQTFNQVQTSFFEQFIFIELHEVEWIFELTINSLLTFKMASSIRLFSFNRKYYHVIGINTIQANENASKFNWKNWFYTSAMVLLVLSSATFFIFDAKSMFEYGLSFFLATAITFPLYTYSSMVWKADESESFIGNCEKFIEKSKKSACIHECRDGRF